MPCKYCSDSPVLRHDVILETGKFDTSGSQRQMMVLWHHGNVSVVINDLDSQFDAVYSCGAPGMMKYINQTFMIIQEPIYL